MPPIRAARPFPLDPLLRKTDTSLATFALGAGVHRRQVYRWLDHGLTLAQADTLACRFGLHPVEVWPVEYGTTTEDDGTRRAPGRVAAATR